MCRNKTSYDISVGYTRRTQQKILQPTPFTVPNVEYCISFVIIHPLLHRGCQELLPSHWASLGSCVGNCTINIIQTWWNLTEVNIQYYALSVHGGKGNGMVELAYRDIHTVYKHTPSNCESASRGTQVLRQLRRFDETSGSGRKWLTLLIFRPQSSMRVHDLKVMTLHGLLGWPLRQYWETNTVYKYNNLTIRYPLSG